MSPRRRGWSDITVTDQFCGAGGSSIGAKRAGLRVRMAMNHWDLAVETHNTNFPDTDHDCCDISAADPRRYPSTDILITSPECTTHSPAGGNRRSQPQSDLFIPNAEDPAVARSRATMRDVPRFAEFHLYRRIVVENVVEVTRWVVFHHWLREMEILGYRWKLVSLNSMFCWPTPQSRDRLYVCFWRKGDKAPDLDITPSAPCHRCERVVNAVQTWKAGALRRAIGGQPFGKYRTQYVYTCPTCRSEVVPFYFAALNAIDFSLPATRIGDRSAQGLPPLKPRTIERIVYGLDKFGHRELVVRTNMTSGVGCRVRGLEDPHFSQTASWLDGLFSPFLVHAQHSQGGPLARGLDDASMTLAATNRPSLVTPSMLLHMHADGLGERVRDARIEPGATQTARQDFGLAMPFLTALRGTDASQRSSWAIPGDHPIGTVSAGGIHRALIGPGFAPFIAMRRAGDTCKDMSEPLPTVLTGEHHLVVQGGAQLSMRDANAMRVASLEEEMRTQGAGPQAALLSLAPFIVSHYGTNNASPIDRPVPSVTTVDRHEFVAPNGDLRVEDCYFRMLQPHEIGRAMAFPTDYTVLGNKRDRVKQYGNAVTPPAMSTLIERQVQAMTGERAA